MPIFSAIGAAIAGALFAGSTLAATLISSALAFGARLAVSYLNRPKKRKYSAVQGEIQYGADVPVGAMYGTGKVKGHRAYYAKWGKGNKFNGDVYILSNGWCDGLEGLYFYGEKQTLVPQPVEGGEVARYYVEDFGNNLTIRFYDGRPGQPVDTKLVNDTNDLGRKWKATSVCAGLCYVVVEREYDNRFEKGQPEFEFVLRGLRLYDPRKDSTVAGGSGAHRLDNPATWQFSKNPALQRFNYQLGLKGLISGRTLIGEGKSLGQLDLSSYFAAMNVCDTIRKGKPTYQSAIYVQGDDDHTEILKEFDDAMAGYGLNRRGLSGVIPGAPQIPVLEITAADIPIDRAQELSLRKSAFDMFNMMSGQFTSIESNWSAESLKPIVVNADIATDGRRRQTSNDFLQVSDPDIAQYLLNIRYRQNRKGGQATVPVSRRVGLKVQEGEWVTFQSKSWLITEWRCDERFQFTLLLSETGADIYADGNIEPGPVIIPPSPPINPSILTTVQGWAVEVGIQEGEDGFERPTLRFGWTPPQDPTIIAVRFFYRVAGTTEEFEDQTGLPEKGVYTTAKNVQSGVFYEARATIETVPDRFKTFTPWLTTATKTSRETVYLPGMVDDTIAKLTQKLDWIGKSLRVASDARQQIMSLIAESGAQSAEDFKAVQAKVGNFAASFRQQISAVATQSAAAALSITELTARMNDPQTGLQALAAITNTLSTTVSTIDGELTAVTNRVDVNEARVGNVYANGIFRAEQVATQSGALSTMGLSVSASAGGVTSQAAAFLSALAGGMSEFLVNADRFAVISGSAKKYPLIFQAGVLYLNDVRANMLSAISSTLGNVDISNAIIGNLIVGTSNLGFRAVTANADYSLAQQTNGNNNAGWTTVAGSTIVTQNPEQTPVFCEYGLFTFVRAATGSISFAKVR
ncbi:hypothetical protein [Phyllobacterium sp. YR531]|uniref:hypothetical protein n=1 Tax=Phyllobacterium sp. YR531 TaxID=1144343 RepID=UPI00026FB247|nr:hypothetical protein [Phyllobacterium sp. YR531]EJN04225.1 Protein of unknown function (DUF1983) [Phyllobacterium sp. YR531]